MATDQQKLNPELTHWMESRQRGLKIIHTTRTPSGQTIDWVPIESQHPSGKIASPPPGSLFPSREQHRERPVAAARFEFDDPAVERGPAGTVPIVRPDLSKLKRTIPLRDFLTKRGSAHANRARPNRSPADPNPAGYFHDTDSQNATVYGWDGWINVWDPAINEPFGSGTDHSILQVWLQNYDTGTTHSIEGGWTVDELLNGDTHPHVFTYYTNNGYGGDGDNKGSYNSLYKGWVQYSSPSTTGQTLFPGIRINNPSTFGGTQTNISMKFQLYREPGTNTLNWWVALDGIWMGYYPATLFPNGLAGHASWVGCGGEIFSDLSNPASSTDQMGSGWQAAAGWTKAAFLRNLRNQTDLAGTMTDNNGTATTDIATARGTDPYTIQMAMKSGSSWGSYFYVGGPNTAVQEKATFSRLTFNIKTGGDDLRGDSSATADVALPGGTQRFTLKAQNEGGWGNNSDHVKSFSIAGPPLPLAAFGPITITLTSHNGFLETDDNWNIQSIVVTAAGAGGSATVASQAGNPFARLTGSAPRVTIQPVAGA